MARTFNMVTTVDPSSLLARARRVAKEKDTKMTTSPKRLARIAGVLYLLVGITGGFAEGHVEPKMYVAGNATATAGNVSKALGVALIVAGVCYLVDLLAAFLAPDFGEIIHTFLVIPPIIGEVWMVIYLLVIGVKADKPDPGQAGSCASIST